MKIDEALERIQAFLMLRFREFIPNADMEEIRENKGKAGQLMEKAIGLPQSSQLLDFEDGDLKTYKSKPDGDPLETIAIHQFGDDIDDLIRKQPFKSSSIHKKTSRMIIIPICKVPKDPGNWYIAHAAMIDARDGTRWFMEFESSYNQVLDELHKHICKSGKFHTSNGVYLQLRTKDSKPYRQLYSRVLSKTLCDKRVAIYFRKRFMKEVFGIE